MTRFLHRLARELGKTVGEIREGMSGAELLDWIALYAVELDEEQARELERDAMAKVRAY